MKININKFKFKKIYEMNQTVEQIIQDLKKNINHPLFKDQMEITGNSWNPDCRSPGKILVFPW